MNKQIAILGASGYTGAELVRLVHAHPNMEIAALAADRKAGQPMASVFPHLAHLDLPDLVKIEDIDYSNIDLVFCGLPHGVGVLHQWTALHSLIWGTCQCECME